MILVPLVLATLLSQRTPFDGAIICLRHTGLTTKTSTDAESLVADLLEEMDSGYDKTASQLGGWSEFRTYRNTLDQTIKIMRDRAKLRAAKAYASIESKLQKDWTNDRVVPHTPENHPIYVSFESLSERKFLNGITSPHGNYLYKFSNFANASLVAASSLANASKPKDQTEATTLGESISDARRIFAISEFQFSALNYDTKFVFDSLAKADKLLNDFYHSH